MIRVHIIYLTLFAISLISETVNGQANKKDCEGWHDEIIYHVMQRSFYDSNGDRHGDLNGFVQKLDYLKELGVTTILFTPLYESDFYHNYFPTNYENIDPEYGTMQEYIDFVKAVHKKGMKFLMDMETQYAQSGNIWFDDSYQNPNSQYSDFIYYTDSLNHYPEQIFMPSKSELTDFNLWPGKKRNIVFLDLNHSKVEEWMTNFYAYWVDPNKDGNFDDGVDGFRIDHIMDDLDYKGLFVNMYQDFWNPIFKHCKNINPDLFVLGEQSNWNHYGDKMVKKSGADAAFSFPLRFAFAGGEGVHDMYTAADKEGVNMNADRIKEVVQETMKRFNNGTYSINFLENHDTNRWASVVSNNNSQIRMGAVLNLLLPGVPSIYYGQELGMTGTTKEWGSDANHIPVREAFPWTSDADAKGMAVFYKDTGEWWDNSIYKTGKAKDFSLINQQKDPQSIWNLYKSLIHIRKSNPAFMYGDFEPLKLEHSEILGFTRTYQNNKITVLLNLSNKKVIAKNQFGGSELISKGVTKGDGVVSLQPYAYIIFKQR
jgi:glycosidase